MPRMEQVPSTKTSSHSQQVQLYNYKNCFGVLSIGSTTHYTSKKIFQPEFSQEWQGLEREHVTSILGCGRLCTRKCTRVYWGTAVKWLKRFHGVDSVYIYISYSSCISGNVAQSQFTLVPTSLLQLLHSGYSKILSLYCHGYHNWR